MYKAADFLFPRCLLTCQMIDRPTASHQPIAATEIGRFGSGESNLSIFRSLVFESKLIIGSFLELLLFSCFQFAPWPLIWSVVPPEASFTPESWHAPMQSSKMMGAARSWVCDVWPGSKWQRGIGPSVWPQTHDITWRQSAWRRVYFEQISMA